MRVAIVGMGLMGGSLAMALKEKNLCREVVTLVRREGAATEAVQLGVVDSATTDPETALGQADLVVFSTPVRIILRQLEAFAPYFKPNAIVTDMGSTKQEIVNALAKLPQGIHPIGSHPMCGKEKAGLEVAEASLFVDATWILTPLERTPDAATNLVKEMAEAIGSKTQFLPADRHDKIVASISHLPYTMAAALVLSAQKLAEDDPAVWDIAASGFRDTSRVAASDVTMFLDILLTNREALGDMLEIAQIQLDRFAEALATDNEDALRQLMEQAAKQRKSLFQ